MTYLESIIHLIVVRTCGYLENQGRQNTWERFLTVQQMVQGLTEEHLHTWKNASLEETSRYTRVLELMGEDEEEDHVLQSVLDLCVAVQCVPEFQAFLNFHTGAGVTLHLAYGLEGIDFPKQQDIRKKIELLSNVCYVDAKKSPVQYQDLVMDDRILSFLMGDDALAASLQDICFVFRKDSELHPLYMYEEEAKKATECLHSSVPMVQLAGKGGRRFLAKHIAKMLGKDFLFVSLKELGQLEGKDFEILRMELISLVCRSGDMPLRSREGNFAKDGTGRVDTDQTFAFANDGERDFTHCLYRGRDTSAGGRP